MPGKNFAIYTIPEKNLGLICRTMQETVEFALNDYHDSWRITLFFVQSQQNSHLSRGSEFGYNDMGCIGTPPNSDAFLSVPTNDGQPLHYK